MPFLGLPSLRRFSTDALVGNEHGVDIELLSVTDISIDQCIGLAPGYLDELVLNCPRLESFRHGYSNRSWRHLIKPADYYPAILHAKHTLKELWLNMFPGYFRHLTGGAGHNWPSFSEFTKLQLLQI
ncbi:uncharacterized protein BDV17DRAFT_259361 [Aspergillus undulatus]|uniref:uncharacterized protein n=1 Tax=Aspergillus undulatus TaxID=1810928 RepID=UPI003CCE01CB